MMITSSVPMPMYMTSPLSRGLAQTAETNVPPAPAAQTHAPR